MCIASWGSTPLPKSSPFIFNLLSLIIFRSELRGGLWAVKARACDLYAELQCLGFREESTACWWRLVVFLFVAWKKKKHVDVGCKWAEWGKKGKKKKEKAPRFISKQWRCSSLICFTGWRERSVPEVTGSEIPITEAES